MTSPIPRLTSSRLVALVSLAAVACSSADVAGPREQKAFDAPVAQTGMQTIDSLLAAPAWQSFAAMSSHFGLAAAATGIEAQLSLAMSASPEDARRLATASAERVWAATVPALPPQALGTTYVWDPAQRRYVAAAGRGGAPANGARFVLYAVNPVTREPVVGTEIGYADLADIGVARPSGVGLRLEVVFGSTTFLDYTVIADGTPTSGTLSASGFLTDGATRLNFGIAASGSRGPTGKSEAVDFQFDVVDHDFGAVGSVRSAEGLGGSIQRVDLAVRVRDTRIRFAVTGDDQTVNASVLANERIFATVTGDPRRPVVRGAGGRELRPDEAQALGRMLGLADMAFRVLGDLLKPVEAIFALRSVP